jgi:23S rRNA (uracil1939-C5)-methyltransferase
MELTIDRPAAGGRMIARHEGQIVFVAGAIPGERVRVRVERAQKSALWAHVVDILEPSPDRRDPVPDPACGGLSYSHIRIERQRQLKGDIIADAFRRLGNIALPAPPMVAPSPETGYRLRARQHVRGGRAGFFREGTHDLCDAAPTQQLRPETTAAADALLDVLRPRLAECDAIVVAENHRASERVFHIEPREGASLDDLAAA